MPTDPWDNPTKVYPVGIHSSRVRKPNDVHGDMLFYEDEPHWRLNPTLDPE